MATEDLFAIALEEARIGAQEGGVPVNLAPTDCFFFHVTDGLHLDRRRLGFKRW